MATECVQNAVWSVNVPAKMRSVWFVLIGPTVEEVNAVLRTQHDEGGGYGFVGPSAAPALYMSVYDYAVGIPGDAPDEEETRAQRAAIGSATPTVLVMADVSGRVPGDEQVKGLAELLLSAFNGFGFDDYFSYDHAWTLAEIRNDARVDGLHFFDYEGSYERYKASKP